MEIKYVVKMIGKSELFMLDEASSNMMKAEKKKKAQIQ